jgi:hypothetical protein
MSVCASIRPSHPRVVRWVCNSAKTAISIATYLAPISCRSIVDVQHSYYFDLVVTLISSPMEHILCAGFDLIHITNNANSGKGCKKLQFSAFIICYVWYIVCMRLFQNICTCRNICCTYTICFCIWLAQIKWLLNCHMIGANQLQKH